jgi:hypothetical protein
MAFLKLDKIVFVIAGKDDRKPLMTAPETRHQLGISVLENFAPIFCAPMPSYFPAGGLA